MLSHPGCSQGPSVHGYGVPTKLYLNVGAEPRSEQSHAVEYCRSARSGAKAAIVRGIGGGGV